MQRAVDTADRAAFPEDEPIFSSGSETSRPESGRPASGETAAAETGEALPLSLAGDLRTMLLADVLVWIATRHKTGTLRVRRDRTRKRVVFRDGVLRSSSSNDPRETLGQLLVRDGLISEEQLSKTLLKQERQGALLGILLVAEGLLSAEQLKRTLRAKAEQIVYDLFLWEQGAFQFQEGLLPRNVPMSLELDTQAVVQEGNRRRKRWQRIRQKFPTSEVSFAVGEGAEAPADPVEREIFQLAAAGKTLAEIGLETRRSEFETAEQLSSLVEVNLLRVARALPDADHSDASGAIERLMVQARAALRERRFDAAAEAFQDVLGLDHLNQDAKQGLQELAQARQRQRASRRIPPEARLLLLMSQAELQQETLSAEERFVVSRVNGRWDVQSILKLCPLAEEEALALIARLVERKVIELGPA